MADSNLNFLNTPGQRKAMAVAVSAALGGGGHVFAAETMLEEVIVTATKRSANMQDLPQSIQAFTTDDIQRRGFKGIDDYSKQIPGIAIARREPGGTSIVFRGVASSGIQFGTNPSASIYLDEQPITVAGLNPDPYLIDIARVEALSGPQGTLFGDASQSGTLRIITNKPNMDGFDAWVEGGYNSVEEGDEGYELSGMVNLPLSDNVAIRLTGFTLEDAGYIDNVAATTALGNNNNDAFVEDDINSTDKWGGRASLRWDINTDWNLDLMAIYQDQNVDGFSDVNTDLGDLEQARFYDENLDESWYQLGVTLEGRLGWADATLAVSYFDRDFTYEGDVSAYIYAFTYYNATNTPDYAFYDFGDPLGFASEDASNERWSVEARLATPSDSNSKWAGLVGFFYAHTENNTEFRSTVFGLTDTPGGNYLQYYVAPYYNGTGLAAGESDNYWFGNYDSEIDQTAVFGEVSYDITENLTVTAGGRWYKVDDDYTIWQGQLMQGNQPADDDFTFTRDQSGDSDDGFVPKVNITYNFDDDKMVYATYSEGFRRGGVNVVRRTSVLPDAYDSDTLENYEIGAKTQWLDGNLRVNITGYHMVWDDVQLQANDPQPGVFSLGIVNAAEAEIDGVEMDFAWAPIIGLTIDGSASYIDADISQDDVIFGDACGPGNSLGCEPVPVVSGTQLPISPEEKFALGVEYMFQTDLLGGQPYVRVDYSYIGDSVNSLEGLESVSYATVPTPQDSYQTFDLRVGLDTPGWSASLYVDNVDDERGEVFYNNRWGKQRLSLSQPRTFGVRFRKNFN